MNTKVKYVLNIASPVVQRAIFTTFEVPYRRYDVYILHIIAFGKSVYSICVCRGLRIVFAVTYLLDVTGSVIFV